VAGAPVSKVLAPLIGDGVLHGAGEDPREFGAGDLAVGREEADGAIALAAAAGPATCRQSLAVRSLGREKLDIVAIHARLAPVDLQAAQRRASPADGWTL
jgi:hypothetical protein